MTGAGWLQAILVFAAVAAAAWPLGHYMARVFAGERTWLTPLLAPVEGGVYRLCGVDPKRESGWQGYARAILFFSVAGFAYLYLILRFQDRLPGDTQGFPGLSPDLALNTAVSFLTNTNWQFYSGESTLGILAQTAGLAWHMFVSAGTGIAVAIALMRAATRSQSPTIGNFWVDLTRSILYVLMPIALALALVHVQQGVPQNFGGYTTAVTLEGAKQVIPQGPMASFEAIKILGTNGGGYVNGNSASPFENPTPFTNVLQCWAMFLIGAALTVTFGAYARDRRQGLALFAAMSVLFAVGFACSYAAEAAGTPSLRAHGVVGNLEGKETQFGVAGSALYAVVTTDTSTGAVNSMHDSFTPLGGLVSMVNMQLGEVVFGGVGCGFYGMLMFVVLTVFIAGLMVGRTPEYLGKKIERREIQCAVLASLVVPVCTLLPTAVAAVTPAATATLNNAGPHGFSEMLYAFTSTANNNGSAFAGLGSDLFWNVATALAMFFGRFAIVVPVLALAGGLAAKRAVPATVGTFSTATPLFVGLLVAVVGIVGALTFFPADALGPIVEHFAMLRGATY